MFFKDPILMRSSFIVLWLPKTATTSDEFVHKK